MENYRIENKDFQLYQAASGDWCVSVEKYGEEREYYNCGALEKAYEFILSYAKLER